MPAMSQITANASRYGRAPLLLALVLVWSLLVSTGHQHPDEPHGLHGDCLYCHFLHDGSAALPPAVGSSLLPTSQPAPQVDAVSDPHTSVSLAFQARAPPTFL